LQSQSEVVKKRLKIALETSVIIAASVYFVSKELDSEKTAKDVHYERAQKLITELKNRVAQRTGVVTRTILRESRNALRNAITNSLEREGLNPQNPSIILNQCGDRLERIVEMLSLEPIDQKRKDHFFTQVVSMYSMLLERASLVTERTTRALAEDRTKLTASPRYRGIKSELGTHEVRQEFRQLYNLRGNPPTPRDREILSELAALSESYSAEIPTDLYLASTDSSHFSPMRFPTGIVSDQITKQIEETFHVRCDWPDVIAEIVSKQEG